MILIRTNNPYLRVERHNQVPHIGYGPTTPDGREGTTNLKELNPDTIRTNPFIPPQWPRACKILSPIRPI
jgi:hypothetical protein